MKELNPWYTGKRNTETIIPPNPDNAVEIHPIVLFGALPVLNGRVGVADLRARQSPDMEAEAPADTDPKPPASSATGNASYSEIDTSGNGQQPDQSALHPSSVSAPPDVPVPAERDQTPEPPTHLLTNLG